MTMYEIEGKMNSGKTLALTYYAIRDYIEKRIIISNFNINIPHYEINQDFLLWLAEEQPDTKYMSFFFDELWLWGMDARSASGLNKVLSYFFLQSSKGDTRCYMTTQRSRQLDIRLRENVHLVIKCKRFILIGNRLKPINDMIRDIGKEYYDKIYIRLKEYEPSLSMLGEDLIYSNRTTYIKASWLFDFYNTDQKMKPIKKTVLKTQQTELEI